MSDKKCTSCGSTNLIPMPLLKGYIVYDYGDLRSNVDSFACSNCGHIELYARQSEMEEYYMKNAEQIRLKEEKERMIIELKNKRNRMDELKSIISDEDQTVRTVNMAKKELTNIKNEIDDLERRIKL